MAESSSPAEVDYLDLCGNTVRNLEDVVARGEGLLNPRQCKDLLSKISTTTRNVRELVLQCETSIVPFQPALENLYRCVEKAEALVRSCAEGDWCAAAALQIRNESAFRDILMDMGSCYKTIHEVAKSATQDWNDAPEDLQQSSVFEFARDGDIHEDQVDLEKRLDDSAQVVLLNLCRKTVLDIRNHVKSDKVLLNQRQCVDLSTKLCITALNVFQLVSRSGASVARFQLGVESLYRFLEKAKAVVSSCAEDDWLAAAVFQIDNENAFRMVLLDVSLCYNAIYELAKSTSTDWNNPPEDLRQPSMSVFKPAGNSDVDEDKVDLQKRLDDLANGYTKFKPMDYLVPGKISRTQSLAKYLLVKMCGTLADPQEVALSTYSAILWRKVSEPMLTWGSSRLLGSGSGASGVVSTTWLGVPCAKKEFHGQVSEGFFLKEAGILAHLKHPCIVNFVCCGNGVEKGDRFIAMELMEKSLADLIEEQNGVHFPLHVVDMMVQLARGVCYLHGRGVAHRDLKPQNVVVSRLTSLPGEIHYYVKLVDFGMSKTKVEVSKANTMSAFGIGTTRYRAPEVGRQAHPDGSGKATWFKADVFSFAMTCAHLLSLKTPFGDMQALHELYKMLINGARLDLPSDCPEDLEVLLQGCWNTVPELRPTFKEVCTRLETFKYAMLQGFVGGYESDESNVVGFDFIEGKVEESSYQIMLGDTIDDDKEGNLHDEELQILSCPFGHALEYLPPHPSWVGSFSCNICRGQVVGEFYQCRGCDFDAHLHCLQLWLEVDVFFHKHPLHLLIRNYYNGDPEAICSFCEEEVQYSEWVYRCDECDIDVHALCTKYPEERMKSFRHRDRLILKQCPPRKSFSCACCNGAIRSNTWRYMCHEKWCTFDAHPSCLMAPGRIVCVFDNAYFILLSTEKEQFYCGICGGYGFSWYYRCEDCDVNIHLECIHDILEGDNSHAIYEEYTREYMTKDDLMRVGMITQILDKVIVSNNLGESPSSTLGPTPEVELGSTRRVQPTIRRPASSETLHLDAMHFDDVDLRNKIAAETAERKAKRMTAKAGRLDSKVKYLKMLENLERMVLDLRSSESMLQGDGEVLDARLEKLKTRKHIVEDEMASLVQSRMRHGPRTCLFYLDKYKSAAVWELLTSLRADMEGVRVMFLCEEPGHQHEVDGSHARVFHGALGEELVQKFQPLLSRGLEVVARAVSALSGQLSPLDRVTLPVLGSNLRWDLRAIEVEKHGQPRKGEENAEALKSAEDSMAEWFLGDHVSVGPICKVFNLLRVRYKVTEEGDCPGYDRGSEAWLCKEHVQRGLEDGILELYPLKFYNSELN